ncbi:hypothetical protein [Roseinatronobacter sp. NSM]|uniref:hypothetical protein n=1 Tax=Roseinatronobacter sp. NSM TaxID=3457785 RepID=UPI004035DF01
MSRKVRTSSRAAAVVKTMLELGVVPRRYMTSSISEQAGRSRTAFTSAHDLLPWAARLGLEVRPHDAVELGRYLRLIVGYPGDWDNPPGYYPSDPDAVALRPLPEARGRWMDATEGRHDFPDDGLTWKLDDGSAPGDQWRARRAKQFGIVT